MRAGGGPKNTNHNEKKTTTQKKKKKHPTQKKPTKKPKNPQKNLQESLEHRSLKAVGNGAGTASVRGKCCRQRYRLRHCWTLARLSGESANAAHEVTAKSPAAGISRASPGRRRGMLMSPMTRRSKAELLPYGEKTHAGPAHRQQNAPLPFYLVDWVAQLPQDEVFPTVSPLGGSLQSGNLSARASAGRVMVRARGRPLTCRHEMKPHGAHQATFFCWPRWSGAVKWSARNGRAM